MEYTFVPVVSVLGHVDHGKTTLLDAIRKTNVASREHGGITQKIGASQIEIDHEGERRKITFVDTPGHETFANMRTRGARVADIGVLVVSAVDGVMPQTRESITLLKNAEIPYVVALTKADLPDKNIDKVKQQLSQEGVLVEGYGGDIPILEVSAKTGQNVKELLDLILLMYEVSYGSDSGKILPSPDAPFEAVVIESKLDSQVGPKASIIVKNGSASIKDELITDDTTARARAFINDAGKSLQTITIGDGVEVMGFEKVPAVGSFVYKKGEKVTEETSVAKQQERKSIPEGSLGLMLVTDTEGSLEAIMAAIPKDVALMEHKTGEVSEADVLFAKSTGSIILSFNVKLRNTVIQLAKTEKVLLKNYTIIYELLDELKDVMEGKRLAGMEQIYGVAQILATFPFEKSTVLGLKVIDGRVAKGDKIRMMRDEEVVGESHIVSVRQGKNATSKVEAGQECGILISPLLDFQVGDVILSHS
ncbi:MAG TPA: translation initiation factor IF-2 [Patescibacteria group bacterium]|nr:translation initiation factor IF-2 [Patescibacteria group bacterium]